MLSNVATAASTTLSSSYILLIILFSLSLCPIQAQKPEQSVMQALESLNESQVRSGERRRRKCRRRKKLPFVRPLSSKEEEFFRARGGKGAGSRRCLSVWLFRLCPILYVRVLDGRIEKRRAGRSSKVLIPLLLSIPSPPFHVHAGWKCLYKSRGPHHYLCFFLRKKIFSFSSLFFGGMQGGRRAGES